jgi:predicted dinucleotide-binding enzyme
MTTISIIGGGNMGTAIGNIVTDGGHDVQVIHQSSTEKVEGDVVILAVPYPALADIVSTRGEELAGKIVVDITNPVNFDTFDELVVAADSSAAAELAAGLPNSRVLKAFNTTFAGTLAAKTVGGAHPTTVLIAGDDAEAKTTLAEVLEAGGVNAIDAGRLKRARELEAMGFLQLTLAAQEKVAWTAGFAVIP